MRTRFSPAGRRRVAATIPLAIFTLGLTLAATGSFAQEAQALDSNRAAATPAAAAPAPGLVIPPRAPAGVDSIVGSSSGPPTPPTVPGSRVDMLADPQHPGPGESTQLTVTVSGSQGSDRYAVTDATVDLVLVERPDDGSRLSETRVKTDVTGSVTVHLTLSRTRGRTLVRATSVGISSQVLLDTLASAEANRGRARHSSTVIPAPAPVVKPEHLLAAAVLILLVSFLLPYRGRLRAREGQF